MNNNGYRDMRVITMQGKVNLRDERGLRPFPDETPLALRLFTMAKGILPTSSPVPVPNVASPHHIYLDLSKWNWPIDLTVAYERGIRAVWIKSNQGLWPDAEFDNLVRVAQDANMEIGFYHFLDPGQSGATAEASARLAYDMTRGIGRFSMWLDVERRGSLTSSQLLAHLIEWCEVFGGLSNRKIDVYTRLSYFNLYVARSNFWRENKIDLAAARYHLGLASPWSDGRYLPLDWDYDLDDPRDFDGWQYSDNNGLGSYFGSQGALSIDLNIFPGTFEQLVERQVGEVVEPPVEPPAGEIVVYSDRYRTRFQGTNFRSEPSTARGSATVIKKLDQGTILTSYPCPTEDEVYANMRTFSPGDEAPQEAWVHGRDESGQDGWIAAWHPTVSESLIESIEPDRLAIEIPEAPEPPVDPEPEPPEELETITVRPKEGENAVVFELVSFDDACPGQVPKGKPYCEPPNTGRIVYRYPTEFQIKAKAWVSCKDNQNDHIVKGAGFNFGVVAPGQPGAGSFVRLDKIDIV